MKKIAEKLLPWYAEKKTFPSVARPSRPLRHLALRNYAPTNTRRDGNRIF